MASTTSFKQQCPSCEAMVPIRDPALVGRKIDCPKCKYRFVVEKPEDDEDDSSDTPPPGKNGKKTNGVSAVKGKAKPALRRRDEDEDEEDDRPQKKKSGASTTVILGGILGLLALGLLTFGAMFALGVFGGSAKTDSSSSSSGGSSSSNSGSNSGPQAAADTTPGSETKKEEPAGAVNALDISNLLPNDSEAVVNYQIDKLAGSSFRDAALQTTGAFNEAAFKSTFDFPLYDSTTKDGLQRVVTALNNSKHWVFTVVRTMKPIKKDKLIENLGLEKLAPVNGLAVYSVKQDLDGLSNLLIKANRPHDDFQVCFLDGQTLVFADPVPMAKFLADGGKPKHLTETDSAAPPPPAAGSPSGSPMPGGSPSGSPFPGGSPSGSPFPGSPNGSAPPGMPGMTPPGGAPASAPAPAVAGSYLTINPSLKAMFDKLEKPDQPTLFSIVLPAKDSLVEEFDHYAHDRVLRVLKAKGIGTDDPNFGKAFDKQQKDVKLEDLGIRRVGVSLSAFSQDKFGGAIAIDWINEALVKKMGDAIQPQITRINAIANGDISPDAPPGGFSNPMGEGFPPGGSSSPRPGGLTPSSPPGGSSSPFPGGSSSPMPGGLTPSSPPGGSYPGSPGGGYPGSPGGGYPGSPGGSGSFPGGNPADAKRGPFDFVVDRSVMALSFTLPFKNDIAFGEVALELGQFMIHLKGESELISTRSRIHELAAALNQYVKANGHFPRGTADRPTSADQFAGWAPDQRVSWMAEMVPYLGDGEFQGIRIDSAKSWQEGANLSVAGILVPQFLGRPNPLAPPLGHYPGVAPEVAATNYVGVAGVGLDAAGYATDNPNAGIFGYNRETKPADVKRGLDKTISLLQVPPEVATPWLAGGGATVRGVSEGPDAVKPFVCGEYQGKRGTFAIMGDGKVRFIPETIDPKIFRTLCLIAGGEKIENLDKIAPVVAGEGQPELKAEAPPVAAKPPAPPEAQTPTK